MNSMNAIIKPNTHRSFAMNTATMYITSNISLVRGSRRCTGESTGKYWPRVMSLNMLLTPLPCFKRVDQRLVGVKAVGQVYPAAPERRRHPRGKGGLKAHLV